MTRTTGSYAISITNKKAQSIYQMTLLNELKSFVMCDKDAWRPDFFNLYSEHILRQLEDSQDGVLINGTHVNIIRYADNTALIADSKEGFQTLVWDFSLT